MSEPLDISPLLDPEIMQLLAGLKLDFGTLSNETLMKIRKLSLWTMRVSECVKKEMNSGQLQDVHGDADGLICHR